MVDFDNVVVEIGWIINCCIDNIGNFCGLVNFIDIVFWFIGVSCIWICVVLFVCKYIFCYENGNIVCCLFLIIFYVCNVVFNIVGWILNFCIGIFLGRVMLVNILVFCCYKVCKFWNVGLYLYFCVVNIWYLLVMFIVCVLIGGYIDSFVVGCIELIFNMFCVCNVYFGFEFVWLVVEYIYIFWVFDCLMLFIIIWICILFVGSINGVCNVNFCSIE